MYTKGPWYIRKVAGCIFVVDQGEHQSVAEIMHRWDRSEEPDNAELIARAPDMHQFIVELFVRIDRLIEDSSQMYVDFLDDELGDILARARHLADTE